MADKFTIDAADGHRVQALRYSRGGSRLLIVTHGITSEKTEEGLYDRFAEHLSPTFDVVAFDFRGHGESAMAQSDVTIAGEVLDLMAVFGWAQQQSHDGVSHLGTSFGASITLLAVSAYGLGFLRKVAFWNPVISYRNTFIEAKVEWGASFFDQKETIELAYRRGTRIPETEFEISARLTQELLLLHPEKVAWPRELPLLIIHGDRDTLVPVDDSLEYARRNDNVEIRVLSGVDHGFDNLEGEAIELTSRWFDDREL